MNNSSSVPGDEYVRCLMLIKQSPWANVRYDPDGLSSVSRAWSENE